MSLNINNTAKTNYSDINTDTLTTATIDSARDQEEIYVYNERASTDWGMVMGSPKLFSAISMASVWTVGKGWVTDVRTQNRLDLIDGNGKQTFKDILYSMEFTKRAMREAYALIVWNDKEKRDWPINLIVLDPMKMRQVYGSDGRLIAFDQMRTGTSKNTGVNLNANSKPFRGAKGNDGFHRYDPRDIFYLANDCVAGSMHGISVPEKLEKYIKADDESFVIMKKMARFQAVPFIMYKVKSDDTATINTFKTNIKDARENGEDLIIPDDENLLSYEVVQVNPSSFLLDWRESNNRDIFRAVGMPLVLFGGSGASEAEGKVGYLGHETVFENNQKTVEEQIERQLNLTINLNSPTSLLENMQSDEMKDAQNGINFQPQDAQGGRNS